MNFLRQEKKKTFKKTFIYNVSLLLKMNFILFSFLFFSPCFCITTNQPVCFFTPPPDWDFANPKILAPRVKIAFVGKTKQALAPSVILAVESTKAALPEYLKAVENIYEKTRKTSWRHMGLINTYSGPAHLMQIDSETKYGPLRKLQLIFVKDGKAYVLTTSALKKEFPTYLAAFQKTLLSFTCTCDLYAPLSLELQTHLERLENALMKKWSSLSKKEKSFEEVFNQVEFQENYWLPLQKKILEDSQGLGAYWQTVVLESIYNRLSSL
jgi:hypothetical protein